MSLESRPHSITIGSLLTRTVSPLWSPRTYRGLLYLVLMFVLGNGYLNVLVVGTATAIPLVVGGVGVLLCGLLLVVAVELSRFERHLVSRLLDVDVPVTQSITEGSRWSRAKRFATDVRTWKAPLYLLTEFVYGTVAFTVVASLLVTAVSFLTAPLYYTHAAVAAYGPIPTRAFTLDVLFSWDSLLIGLNTTFRLGSWHVTTLPEALLFALLGGVFVWIALLLCNCLTALWGRYARRMLTIPRYWNALSK